MIRLMLVDDHELVRRGLTDLLESEGDITVVAQAGSVAEAIDDDLPPLDAAVLDVRLPWCPTFSTSACSSSPSASNCCSIFFSMSPVSRKAVEPNCTRITSESSFFGLSAAR